MLVFSLYSTRLSCTKPVAVIVDIAPETALDEAIEAAPCKPGPPAGDADVPELHNRRFTKTPVRIYNRLALSP
jgi:hypothetical protein